MEKKYKYTGSIKGHYDGKAATILSLLKQGIDVSDLLVNKNQRKQLKNVLKSKDIIDNDYIFMQMSNSRSICGVWNYEPNDEERSEEYSKFMKKEMDIETTRWNTWVEKHKLIKSIVCSDS